MMTVPKFGSRDEFESYLNKSDSRLKKEASTRDKRAVLIGVPIAIVVCVVIFVATKFIGFENILHKSAGYDPEMYSQQWENARTEFGRAEYNQKARESFNRLEELRRKQ